MPAENHRHRTTVNGRYALYRLFVALRLPAGSVVLFPSFHCPTVVEPAIRAGLRPAYYDVSEDLSRIAGPVPLLSAPAAIVVINYFGFEFSIAPFRAAWPRVPLIEDCSHSFLRADTGEAMGTRGDASVYSYWKILPIHIGGGVRTTLPGLEIPAATCSMPLLEQARLMRSLLAECLANAHVPIMSARLRPGPKPLLAGPVIQPPLEDQYPFVEDEASWCVPWWLQVLARCGQMRGICAARRRNYEVAVSELAGVKGVRVLRPKLEPATCPWALPVLLEDRRNVDYRLRNAGVPLFTFGETLHPTVTREMDMQVSRRLSANMLCLPVHQRLDENDVVRYCRIVSRYFAEGSNA